MVMSVAPVQPKGGPRLNSLVGAIKSVRPLSLGGTLQVYSQPLQRLPQSTAWLSERGIDHEVHDITLNPPSRKVLSAARNRLVTKLFAPVVRASRHGRRSGEGFVG